MLMSARASSTRPECPGRHERAGGGRTLWSGAASWFLLDLKVKKYLDIFRNQNAVRCQFGEKEDFGQAGLYVGETFILLFFSSEVGFYKCSFNVYIFLYSYDLLVCC